MKSFKIYIFLFFILLSCSTFVLARVVKPPDSSALQPIPSGMHPNVFNDINFNNNEEQPLNSDEKGQNVTSVNLPNTYNNKENNYSSSNYFWIFAILILVVSSSILFWLWLKKHRKNEMES